MRLAPVVLLTLPALAGEYATYIGDSYPYNVAAMATDAAGNLYITGSRLVVPPSSTDVFLNKLDANGNIVFTVTMGGKGTDQGSAIALDPAGNIYVAGSTTSSDFPLTKALQTRRPPVDRASSSNSVRTPVRFCTRPTLAGRWASRQSRGSPPMARAICT